MKKTLRKRNLAGPAVVALLCGADVAASTGTTTPRVAQNPQKALGVGYRGDVLGNGRVTLTGPGRQRLADGAVKKAYLGG